ncbi:DUF559 domain-containing protein [Mycolicibacterium mengxianglii]|uniref:DUF559 domain-containing protein n=1 Tax=Mycolicibacterium mengxianglii TaxID=2736649 RepID=UPI0018EF1C8E|nr:DUF559 domain-containing protein [Mycolicibacterium mengxianglii]
MDDQPFRGSLALQRGMVTRNDLRRKCRRLFNDVYISSSADITALTMVKAAWVWAGPDAVLCGRSAAAVLGTKWLSPSDPVELVRAHRQSPKGIAVRSYILALEDIRQDRGMRITTPARTAFDIGRKLPAEQAVPVLDALMNATGLKPTDVMALADSRPRARGVRLLRTALGLADGGAESPKETEVRLLLGAAGLPKPETQIKFFDEYGEAYIRVDMGWRQWKVAVEYDGVQHWTNARQRSWDIERIALLEAMGWVVVRVSAEMLRRPQLVVDRVRAKLRAAGCPI